MKIVINRPKSNSAEKIDAFNKETALTLMEYLKIKREPVITLFTKVNEEVPKTFRARKKLLQLIECYGWKNENSAMRAVKTRNLITISPIKEVKKIQEEECQAISIEYIKRNGYIKIQSINSVAPSLEIKLKINPTLKTVGNDHNKKKKKVKLPISYMDSMIINELRNHQNVCLKDYAEIINILNKHTTLNKSPSTNLRRIHSFIDIKKDKYPPKISSQITEIIICIKGKKFYYYLISNRKNQYLIQEKVIARQLHFKGTFDWIFVINKIQMAFTEATGYLNQEFGLTLEKNDSDYRDTIINAIENDNTFLRKNKRKWREACNIKVLWENHNSNVADIIPLEGNVITTRIHESQTHQKAYDVDQLTSIEDRQIQNANRGKTTNSILKQNIDSILQGLYDSKENK